MPTVDRHVIVAELRASGYDARLYERVDDCATERNTNPDDSGHTGRRETGVAVHAICVQGWRYPDGSWIFLDRPAVLLEPDEADPRGLWRWDHTLSSTFELPDDTAAPRHVAAWITDQLGAPDEPHCRLYRHIDDADPYDADAPRHWRHAWQRAIAALRF
jgi:hypothetical protein